MIVNKLLPLIERYDNINLELIKPEVLSDVKLLSKLTKEQSDLSDLVEKAKEYLKVLKNIEDSKELLDDKELGDLVKEEIRILESKKIELEEEIKILLVPKDPNSNKNVFFSDSLGYNEYFEFKILDYIWKNIYLKVTYDDYKEIIKLELDNVYVNNNLGIKAFEF